MGQKREVQAAVHNAVRAQALCHRHPSTGRQASKAGRLTQADASERSLRQPAASHIEMRSTRQARAGARKHAQAGTGRRGRTHAGRHWRQLAVIGRQAGMPGAQLALWKASHPLWVHGGGQQHAHIHPKARQQRLQLPRAARVRQHALQVPAVHAVAGAAARGATAAAAGGNRLRLCDKVRPRKRLPLLVLMLTLSGGDQVGGDAVKARCIALRTCMKHTWARRSQTCACSARAAQLIAGGNLRAC